MCTCITSPSYPPYAHTKTLCPRSIPGRRSSSLSTGGVSLTAALITLLLALIMISLSNYGEAAPAAAAAGGKKAEVKKGGAAGGALTLGQFTFEPATGRVEPGSRTVRRRSTGCRSIDPVCASLLGRRSSTSCGFRSTLLHLPPPCLHDTSPQKMHVVYQFAASPPHFPFPLLPPPAGGV